jgi:hypothetical protein
MNRVIAGLAIVLLAVAPVLAAAPYRFGPFKDELFKLPPAESASADGSFVVIPFSASRYVNGRDAVPEVKAKSKFVSTAVDRYQQDLTLAEGRVSVKFVAVGDIHKPAKSAFIFVHGRGGNRFQGVDDWTFGGNFNRLKNLMVRNGGVYLSPHVTSAGEDGVAEVGLLIKEFAKYSPGAPIFIGCASNGGDVCWTLASRKATSGMISGLLLLGATSNISFLSSPAGKDPKRYIPVYIAHGNNDKVIRWQAPEIFYKNVRALRPGYPIRFVVFDGGTHGTPMRMTDWRGVLNWMLSLRG